MRTRRLAIAVAITTLSLGAVSSLAGATTYGPATSGWLCFNMVDGTVTHVATDSSQCSADEVPLVAPA